MTTEPATADDDDLIWHYTNAEGLYGIIGHEKQKNLVMHCTNVLFLNDSKEYYLTLEIVKNGLKEKYCDKPMGLRRNSISRMIKKLEELNTELKEFFSPFIASFCEEGDKLSQWRGYCLGGGYSLGFSKSSLQEIENDGKLQLNSVSYLTEIDSPPNFLDFFDDFINSFETLVPDWDYDPVSIPRGGLMSFTNLPKNKSVEELNDERTQVWVMELTLSTAFYNGILELIPFYKHLSFQEENEWRVIYTDISDPKFKHTNNILKPYKELEIPKAALKKIIIGPTNNAELCELGINMFLKDQDLEYVEVKRSEIPYRTHY
ncbi:MAG: DUF2971 domain-containing protein [Vampirovibrionales bacterium]|nr:DUF2971 domain-containing protein [Vampirovibrionales bacterium]